MSREDWKRPAEFSAKDGYRRVAVVLSYDGRCFHGWQSQSGLLSVQDTVKQGCITLTGIDDITVVGSGRTDSGVHAMGQVAHIEFTGSDIPLKAFKFGLNSFLPSSVRVVDAWEGGRDFHARYSAMAREYRYFIKEGSPDCFTKGLVSSVKKFPDIEVLNQYAKCIVGTHDFTTFASADDICPSKVRDIYESSFTMCSSMYGEPLLCYKICGNAFLYHMVRSIVGSMLDYAALNMDTQEFVHCLEEKKRSLAGRTAAPDGLYLWRVSYDTLEYKWFEDLYGRK